MVCFSNCNVQTVSGNFITGDEKKSHNPDEVPREKGAKLFLSVKNKAQKMMTRSGGIFILENCSGQLWIGLGDQRIPLHEDKATLYTGAVGGDVFKNDLDLVVGGQDGV